MTTLQSVSQPPLKAYKFCPKCAGEFKHINGNLLKCQQCGYNFFVNAAPCASAIILSDKKEVLLAKRKFEPYKGTWQTPGGFMKPEESFEEAVQREIYEELGVKIKLGKFLGTLPDVYPYYEVDVPFLGIYCTATITEGEVSARDDVDEVRFVGAAELDGLDITYPSLRALIMSQIA